MLFVFASKFCFGFVSSYGYELWFLFMLSYLFCFYFEILHFFFPSSVLCDKVVAFGWSIFVLVWYCLF